MTAAIGVIAIGVPAHNERRRIGACIRSLTAAADRVPVPVVLIVAADRCNDGTDHLARRALASNHAFAATAVRSVTAGTAGAARDLACREALDLATSIDTAAGSSRSVTPDEVWLVTTDADSTVPADWLTLQIHHATHGYDGVAGLVQLNPTETTPALTSAYHAELARRGIGTNHPHVHGANLGLRGSWFHRMGGFSSQADGEDQALWHQLERSGARLYGATDLDVTTSARLHGRAPAGFAGVLRRLAVPAGS